MHVSEINIYPIKSTRRITLQECPVLSRGLEWDRRWMLVDQYGGFITARKYPRLTLVATRIDDDLLVASAPEMPEIRIPLEVSDSPRQQVKIWSDECTAVHPSEQYDQWFSDYLGLECRLVYMGNSDNRPINPDYASLGDQVSFADGFPLLLISEASLADLNSRLQAPMSMRRFRPNLVVTGCPAFAEDAWKTIQVGETEFAVAKACSRCVFTTIDPDTAEKHPRQEPLRTLSGYRQGPDGGVYFGQNLIPRRLGMIRKGDAITVLS